MNPSIDNDKYFLELLQSKKLEITKEYEIFNTKTGKIIGNNHNSRNYSIVAYYNGYYTRYIQKHRLIWINYRGLISDNYVINHIDGNKQNNNISNLEVVTYSDNSIHAIKKGLVKSNIQNIISNKVKKYGYVAKCTNNKLSIEQVKVIKNIVINYYKGIDSVLANEYGVNRKTISNIRRNKSWNYD